MRILHTSDWHLGKSLYDFPLIDDQQFIIEEIINIIALHKIDAVIIAGDIYDRPLPSGSAIQLYDFFLSRVVKDMGVPVIAIAGNHDSAGRLEFGSSLYMSSGYYIFGRNKKDVCPVKIPDSYGEVYFFPFPYLHPADIRVLLDNTKIKSYDDAYREIINYNTDFVDPAKRNIAVAHGFFSDLSGKDNTEVLTSDSEINIGGMDIANAAYFSDFDYAALGHLHAPQWTMQGKIRYSGSPLKYSLSEEKHNKSVTIVDVGQKGSLDFEIIPLAQIHDVRTLHGSFLQLCDPSYHSGSFSDYVFAEISGETAVYPMEKLRLIFPNILGLSFVDNTNKIQEVKLSDKIEHSSAEELFGRFYREMKGEEPSEESLAMLREAIDSIHLDDLSTEELL